ncbi:MAG: hypothetical protein IT457_15025 [Planctomycetes bacterium]|nr:hypothetical protein [Planctomycetota bacterium]
MSHAVLVVLAVFACGFPALAQDRTPVKIPRAPIENVPEKDLDAAGLLLAAPMHRAEEDPSSRGAGSELSAAGGPGLAITLDDPQRVWIDQPEAGGPIWVRGRDYKAGFAAKGWSFQPRPAPGAPSTASIEFAIPQVSVGGLALRAASNPPESSERHIAYERGGFRELVELRGESVEQSFVFDGLPNRGEIEVAIAVTTGLAGEAREGGLVFRGPFDTVTYSQAFALDARGAKIAAVTELEGETLRIRVPAAFVAKAVLPLVIDPRIANANAYSSGHDVSRPDVCWDATSATWQIVFDQEWSADDSDCFVRVLAGGSLLPLHLVLIDISPARWVHARIGNLNAYGRSLVAAQVSADAPAPYWIAGRIFDSGGNLVTNQFDIERGGVVGYPGDNLVPDVGGDPVTQGPTYFTVVFEHVYSGTDHDIYARQVRADGTLRAAYPTIVQGSTAYQETPAISKSDGGLPFNSQRFVIAYVEHVAAPADRNLFGAMLTWDGQFVPVNGSDTFPIDATTSSWDIEPAVSSPSLPDAAGNRHWLAAFTRTGIGNGDILASWFDVNGTWRGLANVTYMENDPVRRSWRQDHPSIDCDGSRFAVGYGEQNPSAGPDVRMSLVAITGPTLDLQEGGEDIATSNGTEFDVQLGSVYSGTGLKDSLVCAVNQRGVANPYLIDAHLYDAYAPSGGFSTRATGCGNLVITPVGRPVLGEDIALTLTPITGITGFVLGLSVSIPLAPCSWCVLGADGATAIGSYLGLTVPLDASLVGGQISFQGFSIQASGPCLAQIHFSHTVDAVLQ